MTAGIEPVVRFSLVTTYYGPMWIFAFLRPERHQFSAVPGSYSQSHRLSGSAVGVSRLVRNLHLGLEHDGRRLIGRSFVSADVVIGDIFLVENLTRTEKLPEHAWHIRWFPSFRSLLVICLLFLPGVIDDGPPMALDFYVCHYYSGE